VGSVAEKNVFPVRYELGFYIPEDDILHIHRHEKKLQDHINIEASRLHNVNNITRRLKRKKPFELVIG
jgi:hypothetical protein